MQVLVQTEPLIGMYTGDKELEKRYGKEFCYLLRQVLLTLQSLSCISACASLLFLDYRPTENNTMLHSVKIDAEKRLYFKKITADQIAIIDIR